MPSTPETIERAALRYAGKIYATTLGRDHVEITGAMRAVLEIPKDERINTAEARGFITSTGRFVDVREAYKIANNAKQIKYAPCHSHVAGELRVEDLAR
jgi:hypothetical protein